MILSNQKMNNQIFDSKIGLISGAVLFNNKKQKRDLGCADTPLPPRDLGGDGARPSTGRAGLPYYR